MICENSTTLFKYKNIIYSYQIIFLIKNITYLCNYKSFFDTFTNYNTIHDVYAFKILGFI